jgi:TonB family protein
MEPRFFVEQAAGATVIFALATVAAWALRKHTAAARHMVWWLAASAALLLPLASLSKPAGTPSVILAPVPSMIVVAATPMPTPQSNGWMSKKVITAAWFIGFAIMAVRLIVGLGRVSHRKRRSLPCSVESGRHNTSVRLSDNIEVPETFGIVRPVILLPLDASTWPEERLRVVLAHELVHIERRDWLTQLIAQVAACVYWFHPLAWFALSQMRKERELACDDGVLRLGYRNTDYAQHLVDVARSVHNQTEALSPSVAIAARSHLETRIRAILNPTMSRGKVTTMMKITAMSFTAIAIVLFSSANSPAAAATRIAGAVTDPSNAVVPEAMVVLTRNSPPQNNVATTSNNAGEWQFAAVEPGEYVLEVKSPGFRQYRRQLTVGASDPVLVNVRLDIGSIQDSITVQGETSRPLNTSTGAAPQRIRVGGNIRPTRLINKVDPEYPQYLKDAGISGTVVLQAVIDREGNVMNVLVISPSVNPDLVAAALNAVKQWKYEPTLLNGVPVEVVTTISVNFALSHRG